ncbi:hypothetical protein BU15DRAFT_62851 [Melanogaster broomeanus]|nr:hypothetical protein BU15DRAFT_62851 [Melanogaster broomeanus]
MHKALGKWESNRYMTLLHNAKLEGLFYNVVGIFSVSLQHYLGLARSSSLLISYDLNSFERIRTGNSNILPLSTLGISSSQAVWCLYVNATCINYEDSAFALLAMVAAWGIQRSRTLSSIPALVVGRAAVRTASRWGLTTGRWPAGLSFSCIGGSVVVDAEGIERNVLDDSVGSESENFQARGARMVDVGSGGERTGSCVA